MQNWQQNNWIPFEKNWLDAEGNPDGGISNGVGFTISWQRGSLASGRNGAFILDVLQSCLNQLDYYQQSKFACEENQAAIDHLRQAIAALVLRRDRRQQAGSLGTHLPDE